MKTKCSFILKTSVALLLAILMVLGSVSTVIAAVVDVSTGDQSISTAAKKGLDIAGTAANADLASTGSNTSDGTARLFFNMNAVSWWIADSGNQNFAYFYNNTTNKNAWSAHSVQQTGNYYYVVVPSGTWEGVILTRNNTTDSPSWDNKWNQTGDLTWTAGKNYISAFSEKSATCTFSTYQVDSTASLAASKTSMTTAESSTLTPSLSSNTDYNVIKSTSYSVTTNPGSAGSVTSEGVFTATAAGTYTVTATVTYNAKGFTGITKTATATKDITVTSASTPLEAPTNVMIDNSSSAVTVDASPSANSTLSWSDVNNATSYEIYKDGTMVGTSDTTSYSIVRKNSNGGTYTVKAVPSSSSYSTSGASSGIKLTVNKVTLTAPTVVPDKTDVVSGTKVTYTLTDNNTVGSSYYTLQSATTSNGTYSDISGTTKEYTLSPTSSGNVSRYFKATVNSDYSDYFTTSSVTTSNVYVAVAKYAWFGDKVDSATDYTGWNNVTYNGSEKFSTYEGNNIYSTTVTLSNHTSNAFSFCVIDSSNSWYWPSSENANAAVSKANAVAFNNSGERGNNCYGIKYNGKWTIYIDQTNKKVWATNDEYEVKTVARYQSYNVTTGSWNTATTGTTGGTASPETVMVKKTQSTTVTAAAKSGYSFAGWYTVESCTGQAASTATSYSVTPTGDTTYYALFKQNEPAKVNISVANVSNATITAKWNNQTKTNGESLSNVPVGASVTVTVEPASGYYVTENTPTLTNDKFTVTSSTTSISATVAKNATIKPVTNKSSRGTVSVDKTSAHKDEVVKITVTPLAGTLKSLTATYANGAIYTYNLSTKQWDNTKAPTSAGTGALEAVFLNPLKTQFSVAATGADINDAVIAAMPDIVPVGAASTINMTMAYTSDVTINATFDTYSAESNYYYNGYDTSGNALSGYTKKQMTEVMLEGVPYSYYEVSGRSGADQLMTVSKQTGTGSTGYAYFTRPSNWGSGWSNTKTPYAYFFNDSGQVGANYPGTIMTKVSGTDHDFKIAIPDGATKVIFSDSESGGSGAQTVDITMTSTTSAYYLSGGYQDVDGTRKYEVTAWANQPSDAGIQTNTTEYWYNASNRYYGYVNGFNETKNSWSNHNAGSHTTDGNRFAKPGENTGNETYYVMVFYAGNKYTSGSGTLDLTGSENHDVVMWSYELPSGSDDENVTVYAKDGAIRAETFGATYANIADTKIYAANGTSTVGTKHSGSITNQTYETYKAAKGDTIVIKTQIGATDSGTLSNADALKAKYYVRGFCVNGEVSELLEWNSDGLYTLTYKIPEDTEITKFEITPIYYLKDTTANPIVTYRVTGFTDELKAVGAGKPNWGDTLYTYPFYGKLGSNNNALGAYPGQPMVYYKGQYQMQIPQKSTAWDIYYDDSALSGYSGNTAKANAVADTNVSGVTMSNGYYDIVHRSIMGYGGNGASADHVQTYDYGDFFKIFNEKKPVDNIVFDFKYETKKHNFENQPAASITKSTLDTNYGTNGNGFELLTNFHGRNVDLFGTPLSGDAADPSKTTPVYVVSIGGVNGSAGVENIAGYYATEWMVYGSSDGSSYSRISAGNMNSIPPEVLVLNDDDDTSFNSTTYPSADANHNITNWKALYTALEAYRGKPVMISYEAADAQIGAGNYATSGGGGATRNDGRWLYSKNGENITSNIKIQYSENGTDYVDYTESSTVTGLEAYFTNADAYKKQTYATTIDPDKTFDFEAKTTNSDYMFVGWYMADGTKITSDNASHTERSGSYTFVAKFKKVTEGQLVLSHSVATGKTMTIGSADYTLDGSGTAKIGAVVKDHESGEILATYEPDTSDIILDKKYIGSEKNYDVEVTLVAKADENTALGTTELVEDATKGVLNDPFFNNPTTDESVYKQRTYTFSFNVKSDLYGDTTTQKTTSLIYHSYFIQYKFNYTLNYEYIDRNGQSKQMKRMGILTSAEANTYIEKRGDTRYLLTSFIEKMAPYESNFGQDITWNFTDVAFGGTGSNYEYSLNQHFSANQENLNKRNITFALPYRHNNGVAVMTDGVGTKDTTQNLELIAVTDEDGKITQDNRVNFNMIPVLPNNGENGIFTEEGKKNWIAAPATIKDGDSVLNFQYWSVKPTDRAGENDPDVARCYFQGFNFVAYDNYIITPVYGASTVEPSDFGKNTNITYVETNRNQWNTNGTDYDYHTQKDKAADLLYNDFIVAYNYDGKDIFNGDADGEIAELGVVVERIQKLEIKDDGTYDTTLSRYTGIETHEDEVDRVINGTSTEKNYTKHAIATNNLDNKNRIQFYNGVYNTAGWKQNTEGGTPTAYYTYKNYVYRAYSYMKLTDGTIIKSAVPAYFTMYDVATADAADM